jgi:carbon-monoxide dehydrogenase medium subunit
MKGGFFMKPFAYHQPSDVGDAVRLLADLAEGRPLAGGMTLIPTLKQRLAHPAALIDLAGLPDIKGCSNGNATVTIGAMTTHAEVASSPLVKSRIAALAALASIIGDPAVRNRGTIGGSVANNDPAADYPAGVLALGATVVTSEREIAADNFFFGLFETALKPNEIITAIRFPVPLSAGYAKFKAPASRYALVGVFVANTAAGVRVAVTGAGPGVFRVPQMERALGESFDATAIAAIKIDAEGLTSDIHADAGYRAHLVTVMAKRAVAAARGEA